MEHEEALQDKSNTHGDEGSSSRMPQHDIDTVVGTSKKLDELWRCLKDDDGSTVIGVHGPRGAGKTTLLRELSEAGKAEFSLVILVTLQRSGPMVEILQEQIESRLGLPSDDFVLDPGSRATAIFDALKKEKFLLILDDVWQEFYLGIAGIPLGSYNKSRGKVILAASSRSLCVSMGAERLVKVEHLSKGEAWCLFREKVGGDTIDSDPHIEKLAMVIAEECQGLPFAISMVGAVMATKRTAEEWEQAVLELRPKLAGKKSMEYSIFRFCFDNLRDDCIRSCFLYCCVLPECHFNKDELIARWIEGGLLDGFDFKAHAEGENIITGLMASGLIEGCLHCEAEVRLHHHIKHMAYQYIFSDRCIPESVFRSYRREVEFWKLAAGRERSPKAVSANGGPAHVIARAVNWIALMPISDLRACFIYALQTMRLLHFHNLWVLVLSLRQSNGPLYSNLQQLWYLTEVYLDLSYITVLVRTRAITRLLQWPSLRNFLYDLNSVSDGYEREVDNLKLKCCGGDDEREARNWRLLSCGGDDEREFGNWLLINRSGDDEREFRNWSLAGRGGDDEREIRNWRLKDHGGDDEREFGNWSLTCDGGDDEREFGTWSLIGSDGDEEKVITSSLMIRQGGDAEREFGNWSLLGDEGDEEKERRESSLMLRRGGDDEGEFGNWSLLGHSTGEPGFVKEAKENGSSSIGHGGDDEREFGNWRLVSCGNDRVRQLNLQDLEGLQNLRLTLNSTNSLGRLLRCNVLLMLPQCLHLKGCQGLSSSHVQSVLSRLNIKHLSIESCSDLKELILGERKSGREFSRTSMNLEVLHLSNLPITMIQDGIVHLQNFRYLSISSCPKLPNLSSFRQLTHLEELSVVDCTQLEHLIGEKDLMHTYKSYCFVKLRRMILARLPRLEYICRQQVVFPSLESLYIYQCDRLKRLPLAEQSIRNLREIRGSKRWWNALEWEDLNDKSAVLPFFRQEEDRFLSILRPEEEMWLSRPEEEIKQSSVWRLS